MDKAALEARKRELQEAANKAEHDAQAFRKELFALDGEWPQDKEEQLDRALKAYSDAKTEIQGIDAKLEKFAQVEQMERFSETPASEVQHRAPGADEAPGQTEQLDIKKIRTEALRSYLKGGPEQMYRDTPPEHHALLEGTAGAAGYVVDHDFQASIIRYQAGFAVCRDLVRVQPTSSNKIVWPRITAGTDPMPSGYASDWKAETSDGTTLATQNQPAGDQVTINIGKWQPDAIEISFELVEDSEVNLEDVIAQLIAETKGLAEDDAIINGNGTNQPVGILDASSGISTINSGLAAALTYGGLVNLHTGLPAQYRQNASYLMSSGTWGEVLKLEDLDDRPLFPVNAPVDQLWTRPIRFSEYVPAVAAAAKAIIFGDFQRGYVLGERRALMIQRMVERYAPNIGILATARIGGKVVQPGAFRTQTVAA